MDSAPPPSLRSRLLTGFAGLLGAFVLYLLSIGPARYVWERSVRSHRMIEKLYAPLDWALANTPLYPPLRAYSDWWALLAGPPSGEHRRQYQAEQP